MDQEIQDRFLRDEADTAELKRLIEIIRENRNNDTNRLTKIETQVSNIFVVVNQINSKIEEMAKKPEKRLDMIFKAIIGAIGSLILLGIGILIGK